MTVPEWFGDSPGSHIWWQQQQQNGLPRTERQDENHCRVTFLWRDPGGTEQSSGCRRVWINITGVTDHHQSTPPRSLQRLPGSDVWYWQTTLPSDWRGSYCLIPDTSVTAPAETDSLRQRREWWREKFASAIHDPLNPLRPWSGGRGMPVSPLHMPDAPPQAEWQWLDNHQPVTLVPECFEWHSQQLNNRRKIHLFRTGDQEIQECPLVLLLDGQFWAGEMPVAVPLQSLTQQKKLPPAIYVMIDSISRENRSSELTCNAGFWQAVQQELLPLICQRTDWQPAPERTLVAGQSFGGLSAVYATLSWPETFGKALSLSGSFWWPSRELAAGALITELDAGAFAPAPRHIYLDAGRREPVICEANSLLLQALKRQHIAATLTLTQGGHDALCWRGGLLTGLQTLLNPPSSGSLPPDSQGDL